MLGRLDRLAAFQNPEFYKAQAMRLPPTTSLVLLGAPKNSLSSSPYPGAFWMKSSYCSPSIGSLQG
jgi:hypothetical protein